MATNFDEVVDRRNSDSIKWHYFDEDVLPLWVADADFRVAEPIKQALLERVEHGIFGYGGYEDKLKETICARLERLYSWKVLPEEISFFPGVVTGFNLAGQAFTRPGEGIAIQTPVYMPFLTTGRNANAVNQISEIKPDENGYYGFDPEAFEASLDESSRVFILCNPHNPVGRVWSKAELEQMGEIGLKHKLVIVSDEIHADLLFDGRKHLPIASLSLELAEQTVTLMAPSKTFNIPGLYCSFSIIKNPGLRKAFNAARRGLVSESNVLAYAAAEAAYRLGDEWVSELLVYLEQNRDTLADYVDSELPGLKMARPEATYLAWIDCREAGLGDHPGEFFLKQARVGLNEGSAFGKAGRGYVRLNFACPRSTLMAALERMKTALKERIPTG